MNDDKITIIISIYFLCLVEISWLIPSLIRYWRDLKKSADDYLDELIELRKKYNLNEIETNVSRLEKESIGIIDWFQTIMVISIGIPYFIVILIIGIIFAACAYSRPFYVINIAEELMGYLVLSIMIGTIPIMIITIKSQIHQRFNMIKLYIWKKRREEEIKKQ